MRTLLLLFLTSITLSHLTLNEAFSQSSVPDADLAAQPTPFNPQYRLLRSNSLIQDKNFYLLTLWEKLPDIRRLLGKHGELKKIHQHIHRKISTAPDSCELNPLCVIDGYMWDSTTINQVSEILSTAFEESTSWNDMIEKHLRPSGLCQLHAHLSNREMLVQAWEEAAKGMNRLMEVYGVGKKPRYPLIDSVTYDVSDNFYQRLLTATARSVVDDTAQYDLFFQPSLAFGLSLLMINHRDEAARHEPMEAYENKAAFDYISQINWDDYPYSLILVPGRSPIKTHISLSPWAKLRLKLGVAQYRSGKAPLIVVSGGYVNPFQTPYCEAIEMKKYLITHFGIPEKSILVDPHARHTTTNMRNTARLMFRYGIPTDKKAIVTTSKGQSDYIEAEFFTNRCMRELGYLPYTLHKRLERHTQEFTPNILSLHADANDPLDP